MIITSIEQIEAFPPAKKGQIYSKQFNRHELAWLLKHTPLMLTNRNTFRAVKPNDYRRNFGAETIYAEFKIGMSKGLLRLPYDEFAPFMTQSRSNTFSFKPNEFLENLRNNHKDTEEMLVKSMVDLAIEKVLLSAKHGKAFSFVPSTNPWSQSIETALSAMVFL